MFVWVLWTQHHTVIHVWCGVMCGGRTTQISQSRMASWVDGMFLILSNLPSTDEHVNLWQSTYPTHNLSLETFCMEDLFSSLLVNWAFLLILSMSPLFLLAIPITPWEIRGHRDDISLNFNREISINYNNWNGYLYITRFIFFLDIQNILGARSNFYSCWVK